MAAYVGKPPTHGSKVLAFEHAGKRWELWDVFKPHLPLDDRVRHMKLFIDGRAPKANFWLVWDSELERWLYDSDAYVGYSHIRKLRELWPELVQRLELWLRDPETAALLYGSADLQS